jgi:putative glutamine amidotransferase
MKPKIGITRKDTGKQLHEEPTYVRYHERVKAAGGEPVDLVPTKAPIEKLLADVGLEGILLTGGGDLNPRLYGEETRSAENIDDERDRFEIELVRTALRLNLPVFAICRGVQMLNVACGGSLLQDIPADRHRRHTGPRHTSEHHDVTIMEGSRLHALLGKSRMLANSRHHQGITPDRLGEGLVVTATAIDEDIVEALEAPAHRWVLGVQWHPERVEDSIDTSYQALFDDFVRSALRIPDHNCCLGSFRRSGRRDCFRGVVTELASQESCIVLEGPPTQASVWGCA